MCDIWTTDITIEGSCSPGAWPFVLWDRSPDKAARWRLSSLWEPFSPTRLLRRDAMRGKVSHKERRRCHGNLTHVSVRSVTLVSFASHALLVMLDVVEEEERAPLVILLPGASRARQRNMNEV